MIGLLLKDLFNLKKYIKQISFTVVIFGLFAVYLKDPSYFIGMFVMISSMLVITSMSYDEYAKWDKFALAMPVLKRDIVLSKYILSLVAVTFGTIVSTGLAFIMSVVMKLQKSEEILLSSGMIALVMLLFLSILIPILFKYGVEKARLLMFGVIVIPALAVAGLVKLSGKLNIPKPNAEQMKMLGYIFPVFVLAVLFLSYRTSVFLYNKKEL